MPVLPRSLPPLLQKTPAQACKEGFTLANATNSFFSPCEMLVLFAFAVLANEKTYGKLTDQRMEDYTGFKKGKETATRKEFKTAKERAPFKASPYAYTQKCFLDKCKSFADQAEQTTADNCRVKSTSINIAENISAIWETRGKESLSFSTAHIKKLPRQTLAEQLPFIDYIFSFCYKESCQSRLRRQPP